MLDVVIEGGELMERYLAGVGTRLIGVTINTIKILGTGVLVIGALSFPSI